MQIQDTSLLNSLLQVGGPQESVEGTANLSNGESGDFLSLLSEAQQLSKENIDPSLLLSSLEDESLELIPEEKEILKDVLLGNTSEEEVDQVLKQVIEEATPTDAKQNSKENVSSSLLSKEPSLAKNDLPKLDQNTILLNKEITSADKLQNQKVEVGTQVAKELLSEAAPEKVVSSRMKNAQFLSAALPSQNTNQNVKQNSKLDSTKPDLKLIHTSSEEFINNNNQEKASKVSLRQEVAPKDILMKGKLAAYSQEKDILDNNIIKINKTEGFEVMSNEVTNKNSDLVQSEFAVDQVSATLTNVDGGQKTNTMIKTSSSAGATLNLSNIAPGNNEELISKISDYVQQASFNNRDSLDLVVKHDALGQFNVNVNKMKGDNALSLQITTHASEGQKFFVDNEVELVKSLNQAGIKLADVKITSSSESSSMNSDQKNSNDNNNMFGKNQNSSNQDQRENSDSRRRKALWEEYKYQMGA